MAGCAAHPHVRPHFSDVEVPGHLRKDAVASFAHLRGRNERESGAQTRSVRFQGATRTLQTVGTPSPHPGSRHPPNAPPPLASSDPNSGPAISSRPRPTAASSASTQGPESNPSGTACATDSAPPLSRLRKGAFRRCVESGCDRVSVCQSVCPRLEADSTRLRRPLSFQDDMHLRSATHDTRAHVSAHTAPCVHTSLSAAASLMLVRAQTRNGSTKGRSTDTDVWLRSPHHTEGSASSSGAAARK